MKPTLRERLAHALHDGAVSGPKPRRIVGAPLFVLVVLYLVLHLIFGSLTEHGGLITPDGSVSLGVATLGIVVLVLRIAVLFVVPAVIAHRIAAALLAGRR